MLGALNVPLVLPGMVDEARCGDNAYRSVICLHGSETGKNRSIPWRFTLRRRMELADYRDRWIGHLPAPNQAMKAILAVQEYSDKGCR